MLGAMAGLSQTYIVVSDVDLLDHGGGYGVLRGDLSEVGVRRGFLAGVVVRAYLGVKIKAS